MRVLLKVGGAQLDEPGSRNLFAKAVANAKDRGHELILVHGGGAQLGRLGARLGLETVRWQGLRITDAPTAEAALMVLAGSVNRELVRSLGNARVPSVGLSGADAFTFKTRRFPAPQGINLGHVGEVGVVDPGLIEHLLAGGYTPVIATVGPRQEGDDDAPFDNVNADDAVAALGAALGVEAVLFLTDVPGVRGADGLTLDHLDAPAAAELEASGIIAGGMCPKVRAGLEAARRLPEALVRIAPAAGDNAVLAALEPGIGTRFLHTSATERHHA